MFFLTHSVYLNSSFVWPKAVIGGDAITEDVVLLVGDRLFLLM